jgi:hypothetical protein
MLVKGLVDSFKYRPDLLASLEAIKEAMLKD